MTSDAIDRLIDAFCFLLQCWGYASIGFVGLLAIAWITQQIRGTNRQ